MLLDEDGTTERSTFHPVYLKCLLSYITLNMDSLPASAVYVVIVTSEKITMSYEVCGEFLNQPCCSAQNYNKIYRSRSWMWFRVSSFFSLWSETDFKIEMRFITTWYAYWKPTISSTRYGFPALLNLVFDHPVLGVQTDRTVTSRMICQILMNII